MKARYASKGVCVCVCVGRNNARRSSAVSAWAPVCRRVHTPSHLHPASDVQPIRQEKEKEKECVCVCVCVLVVTV